MQRGNYSNQKPEYALKRVNDLIGTATGNNADKEKKFALEQLHNIVSGAKRKTWQKVYEPIMKRHLELCVDLKDHRIAKDGLHQYRNMCQNVEPASLENVIIHLMDLAESRATQARDKANKVALAAAAKISDLDQEETPESIMLSTMTEEGTKDRTDREVVVPWLKFLWETYRAILELLHKNAKLERVYHRTCEKAFKFCLDYQRTLEFRRLCEMLRQHLSNLQHIAPVALPNKIVRIAWEWTPEAIELHLQTRFSQLEVATSLEQWNEGFRTVEDIYAIMQLGKKVPKPKLMATYYEKLTRIFWVSENHLFHAYTWYRFYCLSCECRKDLKAEEKCNQASSVLLSAICIPLIRDVESVGIMDGADDDMVLEKNQQMAMLLDFQSNPTRLALLGEIVNRGILSEAIPELADLYNLLEKKFSPLTLVKELVPILTVIKNHPSLSVYSLSVQRVAVLRLVQQLARVYSAVKMDFVKKLLSGLDLSSCEVEKVIIDGIAHKQLLLRMDHASGCLRFGSTVAVGPSLENQLTKLRSQLMRVSVALEGGQGEAVDAAATAERKQFFGVVAADSEDMHANILERKMVIERRKEGLERLQQERQKEDLKRKEAEEARRQGEEAERLRKEEKERREVKIKQIRDQMDLEKTKKAMAALGKLVDDTKLEELDESSRRQLLADAQAEANRAKEEEVKRLADQAKRLDHITRACRLESVELVRKKYEDQVAVDKRKFDELLQAKQSDDREQHARSLIEKKVMSRMQNFRSTFEQDLLAQQRAAHDKKVEKLRADAVREYKLRKIAKARRSKIEYEERLEELELERLEKEAAELALAAEHERLRQEKIRDAEEEARREEARELKKREDEERAKAQAELDALREERDLKEIELREKDREREKEREKERETNSGWRRSAPTPSNAPSDDSQILRDTDKSDWQRVKAPGRGALDRPAPVLPRPAENTDTWGRRGAVGPTSGTARLEEKWGGGDRERNAGPTFGGDRDRDTGRGVERDIFPSKESGGAGDWRGSKAYVPPVPASSSRRDIGGGRDAGDGKWRAGGGGVGGDKGPEKEGDSWGRRKEDPKKSVVGQGEESSWRRK